MLQLLMVSIFEAWQEQEVGISTTKKKQQQQCRSGIQQPRK